MYGMLLLDGLRKGPVGNTILGWILSGSVSKTSNVPTGISGFNTALKKATCCEIGHWLEKFWLVEDIESFLTEDERACEEHFESTHSRCSDGRYRVRLPLLPKLNRFINFGQTRHIAVRRMEQMERRFKTNDSIHNEYSAFMAEYAFLRHMEPISANIPDRQVSNACYLPHHAVTKFDVDENPSGI